MLLDGLIEGVLYGHVKQEFIPGVGPIIACGTGCGTDVGDSWGCGLGVRHTQTGTCTGTCTQLFYLSFREGGFVWGQRRRPFAGGDFQVA